MLSLRGISLDLKIFEITNDGFWGDGIEGERETREKGRQRENCRGFSSYLRRDYLFPILVIV